VRWKDLYLSGTVTANAGSVGGNITQSDGDYLYSGGGNFDIKHTTASQNIVFSTTPSGGSATEVLRITHDGKLSKLSGDLTLDVAGSIKLDADSSNIYLADNGTDIGLLSVNNEDLNIRNLRADKDIYFQGNDSNNGGNFTALTLDMSEAGKATFNQGIVAGASTAGDWGLILKTTANDTFKITTANTGSALSAHTTLTNSDGNVNFVLGTENSLSLNINGGVNLYYNNELKFYTHTSGATVQSDLSLYSTDETASNGPDLILHRNSATPAASDDLGNIQFFGESSTSVMTQYGHIRSEISSPTQGTAKGNMYIDALEGGILYTGIGIHGKVAKLYYSDGERLATSSAGIDIQGTVSVADDNSFSGANGQIVMSVSPSVSNNENAGIAFGTYNDNDYFKQGIFWKRTGNYGAGELHFANRTSADSTTVSISDSKMMIDGSGNVGIGLAVPTTSYQKVLHIHEASGSSAIHLTNNTTGSAAGDGTD